MALENSQPVSNKNVVCEDIKIDSWLLKKWYWNKIELSLTDEKLTAKIVF